MPVAASKAAMVDAWKSLFVLSSTMVISPPGASPGVRGPSAAASAPSVPEESLALTQPAST